MLDITPEWSAVVVHTDTGASAVCLSAPSDWPTARETLAWVHSCGHNRHITVEGFLAADGTWKYRLTNASRLAREGRI